MTKEVGAGPLDKQFLTDCLNAANDAYSQPGIHSSASITCPGDLKILRQAGTKQDVTMYSKKTGFYGAAFVTSNNKVLISFEGTNFFTKNAEFTAGQVVDDAEITAGGLAPSFTTAMAFTKAAVADAEEKGYAASSIYLDGHSLGSADAEYVAAQTGMKGVTFGTPGIATKFFTKPTAQLTNYVEAGDPVGNYDASAKSPIQNIVQSISPTSMHYGKTNYIGYKAPNSDIFPSYYERLQDASGYYADGDEEGVIEGAAALASAVPAHFLTQYAKNLHVKLADTDHTYGAGLGILCVAQGTRILTTRGDVAVEALSIGDLVVTATGAERPIRWLGHRRLDRRQLRGRPSAWPVRIAKDAFGANMPSRDLLLSPGHAICVGAVDDVLMPAGALIDGAAIARVEVDEIIYWHVELEAHDIMLAENLAVESYLDMGGRAFFAEAAVVELDAGPEPATRTHGDFCRRYADCGPLVEAVRRRLGARAVARRSASSCIA